MLNPETKQRELAYVVKIDDIEPIVGSDNCEAAVVGGWRVMIRKNTFQPNDLGIYFEIDSKVDTTKPEFAFLEKKHGKIKTQRYTFGGKNPGFYSQGLLMSAEDFGGMQYQDGDGQFYIHFDKNSFFKKNVDYKAEDFLTQELGVVYSTAEDNKRKAKVNPDAKINAALQRHPEIAKKYGKKIKNNKFLRWGFLLLFGRKRDVRNWPQEVSRTDEERIENRVWTLEDSNKVWIATEKVDGSSTTFHIRRKKPFKKEEFFICSRNVVFDTPDKPNYYSDTIGRNIYTDMAEKYNIKEVLQKLLEKYPDAEWVTIQGETYGNKVQKRDYGLQGQDFAAFNLIFSHRGRINTIEMKKILDEFDVPTVPIVREKYNLPPTIEELREFVHSEKSLIDGGMKEGIVFRSEDAGDSFKCVDPAFLIKYHS